MVVTSCLILYRSVWYVYTIEEVPPSILSINPWIREKWIYCGFDGKAHPSRNC